MDDEAKARAAGWRPSSFPASYGWMRNRHANDLHTIHYLESIGSENDDRWLRYLCSRWYVHAVTLDDALAFDALRDKVIANPEDYPDPSTVHARSMKLHT